MASPTTSSRDTFFEKKILMLDKRLTLIEKFVELRFRDTFSTFSAVDKENQDDETLSAPSAPSKQISKSDSSKAKRRSSSTKMGSDSRVEESESMSSKNKLPFVLVRKLRAATGKKDSPNVTPTRARVTRAQAEASTSKSNVSQGQEIIVADYERPRYNTRRRGRGRNRDEEAESLVKKEVITDNASVVGSDEDPDQNDSLMESETGTGSADDEHELSQETETEKDLAPVSTEIEVEDQEEVYFMFPVGSPQQTETITADIEEDQDETETTAEDVNYSASGETPNASDAEDNFILPTEVDGDTDAADNSGEEHVKPEVVKKKRKIVRITKVVSQASSQKSTSTSPPKKRGRKPNPNPQIPKPPRRYPSSSAVTLSSDCVAKIDPTKKECPMCHQHIKNEYYHTHLETHMKERHLKCEHCDNRYFNLATLRKHMRVHEPEKYGKNCRLCGKEFYISGKLLAHERFCVKRALESRKFVEPAVIEDLKKRSQPLWSTEISEIMKAVDSNIDPSERKACPQCKRSFKATLLERHLRTHSNTRNWGCSMCTKAYYHKNDLKRHIAADHTNIVCQMCSAVFADKAQLKIHRKECPRKCTAQNYLQVENAQPLSGEHSEDATTEGQEEGLTLETTSSTTGGNIVFLETTQQTLVLVNASDPHHHDSNDPVNMVGDANSPSKTVPYAEVIVESTNT